MENKFKRIEAMNVIEIDFYNKLNSELQYKLRYVLAGKLRGLLWKKMNLQLDNELMYKVFLQLKQEISDEEHNIQD